MPSFQVPEHAVKITYKAEGMAVAMPYWTWFHEKDQLWNWVAGGNCGENTTHQAACERAKYWLRFGSGGGQPDGQ